MIRAVRGNIQYIVNFVNMLVLLNVYSVKVKVAQLCMTLCDPMDYSVPWNSPGQNTGVGSLSLLQGIFLTQALNPGLPHCRQILYQLSHKGSRLNRGVADYQASIVWYWK